MIDLKFCGMVLLAYLVLLIVIGIIGHFLNFIQKD